VISAVPKFKKMH